jgi:non-canonical (house-cleaning) NTP pyrophosphatase
MAPDVRDFWRRFQNGIEVAVATTNPDVLLGVREGLLRYFHDGLEQPVSVAVVPQAAAEERHGLLVSDEEVLASARRRACELQQRLGDTYHFYIGSEAGIHPIDVDGRTRYFVRSWVVLLGLGGESHGGSGSLELPERLVAGLDNSELGIVIPGTRRRGGMIKALTGGLETRSTAVAVGVLHAISTLLYGVIESRPVRRR